MSHLGKIVVFGSHATRTNLPWNDIDILFKQPVNPIANIREKIYTALNESNKKYKRRVIEKIIKTTFK